MTLRFASYCPSAFTQPTWRSDTERRIDSDATETTRAFVIGIQIRGAAVSDAKVLAAFAERAFRDTYAVYNDPANIDAHVSQFLSVSRIKADLARNDSDFFVAEDSTGKIVGYAKLCASQPEPSVSSGSIELERIYVDRNQKGRGIGTALLKTVMAMAASKAFDALWLGVWQKNPDAIRFYEKLGFRIVGTHAFLVGKDEQLDWVMERALGEAIQD